MLVRKEKNLKLGRKTRPRGTQRGSQVILSREKPEKERKETDARAVTLDETRSYCQRSVNFARAALHETRARRKTSRRFNPRRRKHACPPPPPSLFLSRSPVLAFFGVFEPTRLGLSSSLVFDTRVDYARARSLFLLHTNHTFLSFCPCARFSTPSSSSFFPSLVSRDSLPLLYIDRRLFRRRLRPRQAAARCAHKRRPF